MYSLPISFVLLLVPVIACAQVVEIRTANHLGFSRVVFDVEDAEDIVVTSHSSGIEVQLKEGLIFSGSENFFSRLTDDVIVDLEVFSGPGAQRLLMMCDCTFSKSIFEGSMVVLDVRKRFGLNEALSRETPDKDFPEIFGEYTLSVSDFGGSFEGLVEGSRYSEENSANSAGDESQDLAIVKSVQAEMIPNFVDLKGEDSLSSFPLQSYSISELSTYSNGSTGGENEQAIFRNNSVFQRADMAPLVAQEVIMSGDCEDLSFLDFEGQGRSIRDISEFRTTVALEAEEFSSSNVIDLSMTYLGLGLGAEAVAALEVLGDIESMELAAMRALGRSVDGDVVDLDWLPSNLENCGNILVWKVLSDKGLEREDVVGVRSHYSVLPPGIQGALAFRLGSVLLESGYIDAARYVTELAEHLPVLMTGELAVLKSRIAKMSGDRSETRTILMEVVRGDQSFAPEALIDLTEESVKSGQFLGDDVKDLMSSYIQERPSARTSVDLMEIKLKNEVRESNFEAAWQIFNKYEVLVPASKSDRILNVIGQGIYDIESDVFFLRVATSVDPAQFGRMSDSVRSMIVERIAELGFDALAKRRADRWDFSDAFEEQNDRKSRGVNGQSEEKEKISSETLQSLAADGDAAFGSEDPVVDATVEGSDGALLSLSVPLAKAVEETSVVLQGISDLNERLEALGL